jgi:DNA-binding GntR family transcriptional regulator
MPYIDKYKGSTVIQKTTRQNLTDVVHAALQRAIQEGTLKLGHRLRETESESGLT